MAERSESMRCSITSIVWLRRCCASLGGGRGDAIATLSWDGLCAKILGCERLKYSGPMVGIMGL